MWVSRFEWPSANEATAKANIDAIMQKLKDNNFNTVLFQVRGQCDVHYPSPYEPWSDTYNWSNPGWDPLAYAINAAHSRGLKFHAYINTHTLSGPTPPANTVPQHQYNLHGPNVPLAQSWLIRDELGDTNTSDNYRWISPGIPEASWWTRRAIMHVVKNYDVDGVHFDRIRTPGPNYSYDPVTLARFAGDGNPDALDWGDFMRRQITSDLRNIYGEIMLNKPWVEVSAAPFGIVYKDSTTLYQGTGTQSQKLWYQDSWAWMENHVVDFMVPQIYWQVGSSHPFELLLADWQARSFGRGVVAGSTTNGGSKAVSALLAEHEQTRLQSAMGHCIFSVSSMGDYWNDFKTQRYDQPTTVPDMPWKSAPTLGAVVGHVEDIQGNPVVDAKINLTGDGRNYLSAFDGFFAVLDVETTHVAQLHASKAGVGEASVANVVVIPGRATEITLVLRNSRGVVTFDRDAYDASTPVIVNLNDADLAGTGSATVTLSSSAEPSGPELTLAETVPGSGSFTGVALVSEAVTPVGPADPVLTVAPTDDMTVTYNDADDGTSTPAQSVDTARYDSAPPVIQSVNVVGISGTGATVNIQTNEPVTGLVYFGLTCGSPTRQASSATPATATSILLDNLSPNTSYTLTVTVADVAGNEATDDNAGTCYEFRTSSYPGLPFFDDFEDGSIDFPWVLTSSATGRIGTSSSEKKNGALSMKMDSSVDSSYSRNEATLLLDVSQTRNETLSFWAIITGDESDAPPSNPFTGSANFDGVAISTDGSLWYEVQPLRSQAGQSGYVWTQYTVNLEAAANQAGLSLNNVIYIRFNQYDNYTYPSDGIFIDDVSVTGEIADNLVANPVADVTAVGPVGGPFLPACTTYTLTNSGTTPLTWTASTSASHLTLSAASGSLAPSEQVEVGACFNATAEALPEGSYTAIIQFGNQSSGNTVDRSIRLIVRNPPAVPSAPFPADGATSVPVTAAATWSMPGADTYGFIVGDGVTTYSSTAISSSVTPLPVGEFFPDRVLRPDTQIFWQISATNISGTVTGPLWTFRTTPQSADYLTEFFDGYGTNAVDTSNQQWTFYPDATAPGGYQVCRKALASGASFPVNVSGGTAVATGDDQIQTITFPSGNNFPFFGTNYSNVHVSSNGFVAFGATAGSSSDGYGSSLATYFSRPRIALLHKDLVVAAGQCRVLPFTGGIAIGYTAVPEWNSPNTKNSYMVELFYDGKIRITHLTVGSTSGIIGLSRGGGIPADFGESNFSDYTLCTEGKADNLRVSAVLAQSLNLDWDDLATNETGFEVQQAQGASGAFATIATLAPNATSAVVSGLTPDTPYRFRVRTVTPYDPAIFSNVVEVSTQGLPPDAPSAPVITPSIGVWVNVTWNDVDRETTYRLERSTTIYPFQTLAELPADTTTFLDMSIFPGLYYDYRVVAVNPWGEAVSPLTHYDPNPPPPPPPSFLDAVHVTQNEVTLTWQDNSADETRFDVQIAGPVLWESVLQLAPNTTSATVTGLTPDTEYRFRIAATNPYGTSYSLSTTTRTLPLILPSLPAAPGTPVVEQRLANGVVISWDDNSNNEDGFRVMLAIDGGAFMEFDSLPANTTNTVVNSLTPGLDIALYIEAYNVAGGAAGNVAFTSTLAPPPAAPTNLVATDITTTTLILHWTDNSNNEDGFNVWVSIALGPWTRIDGNTPNATSLRIIDLPPNTRIDLKVEAHNEGGATESSPIETQTLAQPSNSQWIGQFSAAVTPMGVRLSWIPPQVQPTEYLVERRLGDGAWEPLAVTELNPDGSALDPSAPLAGSFSYRITGRFDGTYGPPSREVMIAYPPSPDPGTPLRVLTSPTPSRYAKFGTAIALRGPRILVGAPFEYTGRTGAGAAYFYENVDTTTPLRLTPPPVMQNRMAFGCGVALGGTTEAPLLAIGASGANVGRARAAGAVFIYSADGTLLHRIDNPQPYTGDAFGATLAAEGDLLAVGVQLDYDGQRNSGIVWMFDMRTGAQVARIGNPASAREARFGASVALSNGQLAVGAPGDSRAGYRAGAVHLFNAADGQWRRSFVAPEPAVYHGFGQSVALDANLLVVGAPGDNRPVYNAGRAYQFDADSGAHLLTISNPSPARWDRFATAVAATGGIVTIGTPGSDASNRDAGMGYVYVPASGANPQRGLPNTFKGYRDMLGTTVVSGGNLIAIAGSMADVAARDSGRVHLYQGAPFEAIITIQDWLP